MYKIYKGGTLFATIGSPVWVKMQENESYGLSDIENAQGIVVDGTVYHVEGLPDLEGVEKVCHSVSQSGGQRLFQWKNDHDGRCRTFPVQAPRSQCR